MNVDANPSRLMMSHDLVGKIPGLDDDHDQDQILSIEETYSTVIIHFNGNVNDPMIGFLSELTSTPKHLIISMRHKVHDALKVASLGKINVDSISVQLNDESIDLPSKNVVCDQMIISDIDHSRAMCLFSLKISLVTRDA